MYSLSPGYSRFAVEKIDIIPVKLLLASSAVPQHQQKKRRFSVASTYAKSFSVQFFCCN
jgi:hypothetical protein